LQFIYILTFVYIVSYNQPKICSHAKWGENGSTFASQSIIGYEPHGIFIDYDDTIYLADHSNRRILVWSKGSINPTRNLTVQLFAHTNLFVALNGDIFFESGNEIGRIEKWSKGSATSVLVTKFSGNCHGLFVDIENRLYCSIPGESRVVQISLDGINNTVITVAGTGSVGSGSNELSGNWGIYVDIDLNLYVADHGNNRIQRFQRGQLNGTTMAGNRIPNDLTLYRPTDVILDADGFLYIADNENHRIIRAGSNKFHCIVGCTGKNGSASNQLYKPYTVRFDSYGNLYVADEYNHRIQKFSLATNSCGKCN
jgi:hypothetical protein